MQQYCGSVSERQQRAVHRNQALQHDARRVLTTISRVDTSQLERLKSQYQSSVAILYPNWLAQVNSQRKNYSEPQTPCTTGLFLSTPQSCHPLPALSQLQPAVARTPSPPTTVVSVPGVTSPVATVHSTPGVSQGDATHLPTHSSTHQTLLSLSPVQVVSSTTASCCPNTGVYHRQSLSTPSLVSEHAPSVLSHSGRQPDSLIPASTSLAMCTTRVRHSIPELSTSLTNSCPFGDSHTMHASTKPSTVHIAVSKQELVGHESQSETGFGGKGDLCPVPPQVLNSRETHALLAGTCTSAEETPAFLSVSAHTCIEQPSQSTALVAAPLITTHPHSMSIDKQVTSVAASTALPTARTTIPPTTIPVHTMSQPITHTTTSATTVILSDVLSPPSPSLLPVASVSPPALKFDAVSSNPQASDSPPVTTNSAQPQQSILILSQEDSEPSLSLTPPLDDEDGVARLWSGSSGGVDGCTSGLGAPLARGKDSSVSPEGFVVDSDHTSQLLHSAPTLHAEPAPVADEGPDDLEVAVGQSPTDGKSSQSDDGMGEEMVCSGRESVVLDNRRKNEGVTSSVCDFEGPVVKGEIDSLSGSEDSSVADVPLPLSLRPQQHPQQKLNETFASSNNNIDRDSSTSNSEAALHGDVSALGDQGTQAVSSNPQHQDAYTSFLQSVCRTTAIASSPLLDSDSEGMEDVLSGRGREQQSAANHTSPPSSPLSAGDADDGASGAVGGWSGGKRRQSRDGECQSSPDSSSAAIKNQSQGAGRETGDGMLDTSDGSQSLHRVAGTSTVGEKQNTTQSLILQKRLGVWGSDPSLDGSGSEPATASAEDDQGDFDFWNTQTPPL